MRCPTDQTELRIAERQGVEIDYCPQCRGVWLDRGELDKILDRAANSGSQPPFAGSDAFRDRPPADFNRYDDDDEDRRFAGYGRDPSRRRKRSFLDDFFDFD
jgi:uncharacterized protein